MPVIGNDDGNISEMLLWVKIAGVAITVPFGVLTALGYKLPETSKTRLSPELDNLITILAKTILPIYFIAFGIFAFVSDFDYTTFMAVLVGPAIIFGSFRKSGLPGWYVVASLLALLLLMILCGVLHYMT